jgi:hypothetical protein
MGVRQLATGLAVGTACGLPLLCVPAAASAEVPPAILAQAQQAAGGVKVTETGGKLFVVEGVVTVGLLALAGWTICKSSRRV